MPATSSHNGQGVIWFAVRGSLASWIDLAKCPSMSSAFEGTGDDHKGAVRYRRRVQILGGEAWTAAGPHDKRLAVEIEDHPLAYVAARQAR